MILQDALAWGLKPPFDSLFLEPVPIDFSFLYEQNLQLPLVLKPMENLMYVDLKNPIRSDRSLMIYDDAWGWKHQEKFVSK